MKCYAEGFVTLEGVRVRIEIEPDKGYTQKEIKAMLIKRAKSMYNVWDARDGHKVQDLEMFSTQ